MASREKGSMGNFSRGAELFMHQARLFVVAIRTAVLISLVIGLAVATAYFLKSSTEVERYALERNVIAEARLALMMTNAKMELYANGEKQMLAVRDVAILTEEDAVEATRKMKNGGLFGLLTSIGVVFLLSMVWWSYGRTKMEDKRLRGAQLVDGPELRQLMEARDDCSPYLLAGVP
ncbi:MAG: TraD, partial [Burkholderia sp.]|nr:TraD [Burkholderia sp.]